MELYVFHTNYTNTYTNFTNLDVDRAYFFYSYKIFTVNIQIGEIRISIRVIRVKNMSTEA